MLFSAVMFIVVLTSWIVLPESMGTARPRAVLQAAGSYAS
jgi:hypothetical protein